MKYSFPFLLALLFAYLLKYPTKYLIRKLKFKTWSASLISTILFFLLIFTVTISLGFVLVSEMINLTKYLQGLLNLNPEDILDTLNIINNKFIIEVDNEIFNILKSNIIASLKTFITAALNSTSTILQWLIHFLGYIPSAAIAFICTIISTYFFTQKLTSINTNNYLKDLFPNKKEKIINIFIEVRKTLLNYILAYLIIILISTSITFIGFSILKINYSLFLSILAGILDLLPILGIALVYIPLAIFYFINGNYVVAISLLSIYALISLLRQIVEPKIMSVSLGIHPVTSLAAMFIGLQVQGFIGVIFCLFLIVSYNIMRKVNLL